MTEQRTFKVGDVISLKTAINELRSQYQEYSDDISPFKYSQLIDETNKKIKLKIVELPEGDLNRVKD